MTSLLIGEQRETKDESLLLSVHLDGFSQSSTQWLGETQWGFSAEATTQALE